LAATVKLRLFARFRDVFGTELLDLPLPEGATVKDLRDIVAKLKPELAALLARSRIGVNNELASDVAPVKSTDEVALLPPVSGG
jgi:molybdopterin converting factor subunit 1